MRNWCALHCALHRMTACEADKVQIAPYCVTFDFDSLEDGAVTVRDRDTMEQERVKIEDLKAYFAEKFAY